MLKSFRVGTKLNPKKMIRKFLVLFLMIAGIGMFMSSCIGPQMVGRSTINTVNWVELNLARSNYEVLNRVTATATVTYDASNRKKPKIIGENNEFQVVVKPFGPVIEFGVVKLGYLTGDIGRTSEVKKGFGRKSGPVVTYVPSDPEIVARQLAAYRIITEAKALGADALIEPIISSDVASVGKKVSVIKTTISAKAVVIKLEK
jgi:uncharacterized protein YbjQ (UPF0145 family)